MLVKKYSFTLVLLFALVFSLKGEDTNPGNGYGMGVQAGNVASTRQGKVNNKLKIQFPKRIDFKDFDYTLQKVNQKQKNLYSLPMTGKRERYALTTKQIVTMGAWSLLGLVSGIIFGGLVGLLSIGGITGATNENFSASDAMGFVFGAVILGGVGAGLGAYLYGESIGLSSSPWPAIGLAVLGAILAVFTYGIGFVIPLIGGYFGTWLSQKPQIPNSQVYNNPMNQATGKAPANQVDLFTIKF